MHKQKNILKKQLALIDEEVKSIIDFAYKKAEELLKANMDKLTRVANVLLEKEKIDGEEFDEIFNEQN